MKGKNTCKRSLFFRTEAVLLMIVLAGALLTACGSGGGSKKDADAIYFTNNLDSTVHNIYMSPIDSEDWGDPLTEGMTKKGRTVTIDMSKLPNGEGTYDFGVIDENAMNYDYYNLEVHVRDTIILEGSADGAAFTIEHEDGSTTTQEAIIYPNE